MFGINKIKKQLSNIAKIVFLNRERIERLESYMTSQKFTNNYIDKVKKKSDKLQTHKEKLYHKRKDNGLCVKCGEPAVITKNHKIGLLCDYHKEKNNQAARNYRERQ